VEDEIRRICEQGREGPSVVQGGLASGATPTPSSSRPGLGFGSNSYDNADSGATNSGGSSYGGTTAVGANVLPAGPGTVVIKIPNSVVGLLIGKGGDNIKTMQARTGAHIQVTRDADVKSGQTDRAVSLSGNAAQIEAAQLEVRNLLQASGKDTSTLPSLPSATLAKVETYVMKVPNNVVGIIIGKGGENIKMLQNKTGARIQIAKDEKLPERDITLSGTGQQIETAKQEIGTIIGNRGGGKGGSAGSSGTPNYGAFGGYDTPTQPAGMPDMSQYPPEWQEYYRQYYSYYFQAAAGGTGGDAATSTPAAAPPAAAAAAAAPTAGAPASSAELYQQWAQYYAACGYQMPGYGGAPGTSGAISAQTAPATGTAPPTNAPPTS